ncbi:BZ3500_MvSof-1268-A1-R1_Chr1-3g01864 [Microbotryum saponariae]|uniref:BZ3500_MvSof-1268-A1-R1_Chr1-3g01864 protein n=1 Tax=Microbotryum saponariae TaxID=289078 RepID=A0A2X0L3Q4_9BASI|nr:BZ3500_MvSof-1268-A1-R1_Chr1-3g01864 [Microbotryum saponariae]SCZ94762.1 BZ3501_MvSof-1269-A2-R1_Chr1-3g01466 [Microbotryum saponariae]
MTELPSDRTPTPAAPTEGDELSSDIVAATATGTGTGTSARAGPVPAASSGSQAGRQKRHRDDMTPTTPRSEDETKVLGGLTPLAKKGRVQPDAKSKLVAGTGADDGPQGVASTSSSLASSSTADVEAEQADIDDNDEEDEDEDDEDEEGDTRITPPRSAPTGLEPNSPPPTPMQSTKRGAEGQETKAIRKRVANLEWKDGEQGVSRVTTTNESDVEIADVAAEVSESAEMAEGEEAQVADEVHETAKGVHQEDSEAEDKLMKEREASVAADVAESAQMLAQEDEAKQDQDEHIADVASEVAASAKKVAQEDKKDQEVAQVAAEVAESAKVLAPEVPTEPTPPANPPATAPTAPATTSFSAFSSSSSPFASVSGASPLSGMAQPKASTGFAEYVPPTTEAKPKSRTSFGGEAAPLVTSPPLPASHPETVASPPTTVDSAPISLVGRSSPSAEPVPVPAKIIPTFTSSTSSSTFTATTPLGDSAFSSGPSSFAKFASTSGFAAASSSSKDPLASTSTNSGALGSTSTTASGGFGSFSGASPFASISSKSKTSALSAQGSHEETNGDESTGSSSTRSRKMGEPEEIDESKRVFTEQEVVTGEEEDELVHSVRSKLFVMHEGAWAERGVGLLRLNRTQGKEDKTGARLVMRADATHRLLLNATLFPSFSIEVNQEKYVRFAVIEAGEPTSYMLRLSGATTANALVKAVSEEVDRLE